jgi:hypothetical protein
MPYPKFSREEIVSRGEALYESALRAVVETRENIGKMISIDIESGEYAIDTDPVVAGLTLQNRCPDAVIYGKRIGFDAAFGIGGTITRTAQ